MQKDMHFYGTFVIARLSGIPINDAKIIAYSAQYVDDSTKNDSEPHEDGGLLYGIATAHHNKQVIKNAVINKEEQRRVWVPFHFLPGGKGSTLQEKLLCVKDSEIANEMMENHIDATVEKKFGLHLLGVAAHVYMDTFAHYGFSGISSKYNAVVNTSIKLDPNLPDDMKNYIMDKKGRFFKRFGLEKAISYFAEELSQALGHGAVATFPDRPYLEWSFEFEHNRADNDKTSIRDNKTTFIEGCEKLYNHFTAFAKNKYTDSQASSFKKDAISSILSKPNKAEDRIESWKEKELIEQNVSYNEDNWEKDKKSFSKLKASDNGIKSNVYQFHQAAAYHRYYVLKDLLPKHKIAVY